MLGKESKTPLNGAYAKKDSPRDLKVDTTLGATLPPKHMIIRNANQNLTTDAKNSNRRILHSSLMTKVPSLVNTL